MSSPYRLQVILLPPPCLFRVTVSRLVSLLLRNYGGGNSESKQTCQLSHELLCMDLTLHVPSTHPLTFDGRTDVATAVASMLNNFGWLY